MDDLSTTAGTLSAAAAMVKAHGSRKIYAAVTHAVLTDAGVDRLKESAIEEMVTTDSVPSRDWRGFPVKVLSVAELLGEAIVRVHNNQSVTSLFKV